MGNEDPLNVRERNVADDGGNVQSRTFIDQGMNMHVCNNNNNHTTAMSALVIKFLLFMTVINPETYHEMGVGASFTAAHEYVNRQWLPFMMIATTYDSHSYCASIHRSSISFSTRRIVVPYTYPQPRWKRSLVRPLVVEGERGFAYAKGF